MPAAPVASARRVVREVSPRLEDDRSLARDIARLGDLIRSEVLLTSVRQLVRELA